MHALGGHIPTLMGNNELELDAGSIGEYSHDHLSGLDLLFSIFFLLQFTQHGWQHWASRYSIPKFRYVFDVRTRSMYYHALVVIFSWI